MKEISIEILDKEKRKRKFNWSKLLQIKIIKHKDQFLNIKK